MELEHVSCHKSVGRERQRFRSAMAAPRVGREDRRELGKPVRRVGSSNRTQNYDSLARVGRSNRTQLGATRKPWFPNGIGNRKGK
jgi:hypothetical protein